MGLFLGNQSACLSEYKFIIVDTEPVYNFGDRFGDIATIVGNFTDGDGKEYAFAVLDAQYRDISKKWRTSNSDTNLPNYSSKSAALAAKESATYNTDFILNNYTASDFPAFQYARSILNYPFGDAVLNTQLPNAYELNQILTFRTELDALDPTISSNSGKSLVSMFNLYYNWTSTEYYSSLAWSVNSSGFYTNLKTYDYGVVPILEIPLN